MIVKLRQEMPWQLYRRPDGIVNAVRMNTDFLYETKQGWVQGHRGQWLVELGESLRCNLDHEAFLRIYVPVQERTVSDEP